MALDGLVSDAPRTKASKGLVDQWSHTHLQGLQHKWRLPDHLRAHPQPCSSPCHLSASRIELLLSQGGLGKPARHSCTVTACAPNSKDTLAATRTESRSCRGQQEEEEEEEEEGLAESLAAARELLQGAHLHSKMPLSKDDLADVVTTLPPHTSPDHTAMRALHLKLLVKAL